MDDLEKLAEATFDMQASLHGREAAEDSFLSALLIALRQTSPQVTDRIGDHFMALAASRRDELPLEQVAGFDARAAALHERLKLLQRL